MACPRVAALVGLWWVVLLSISYFVPPAAMAEIPRTTAEWLEVYRQRQAEFEAITLESHWQRLEGDQVVEEWDQVFYADDLGRLRIDEYGRLSRSATRENAGIIADTTNAFDGNEYRELATRWEYAYSDRLNQDEVSRIRRTTPLATQGRIEPAADGWSQIRQTQTPFLMADHWFAVCLTNAIENKIEPDVNELDRPGFWEIRINSANSEFGHKCRARVDETQGNRVTRIDLWSRKNWSFRYDVEYESHGGRSIPKSGSYRQLTKFDKPGPSKAPFGGQFVTQKVDLSSRWPDATFLPDFPAGTHLVDMRTGAQFRIAPVDESDHRVIRLLADAREEFAKVQIAREEYARWPTQLRVGLTYGIGGAALGLALRLAQTSLTRHWPVGLSRRIS